MIQIKKKEAYWQTIWTNYLKEMRAKGEMYGFFELKNSEKKSLAFSKIEIHQYDGLQVTEASGMTWKLSDDDGRQKPCDCLNIPPLPSYIVIKFPDAYYVIRIGEIVRLRELGGISITWEQAKKVAEKIVILGT